MNAIVSFDAKADAEARLKFYDALKDLAAKVDYPKDDNNVPETVCFLTDIGPLTIALTLKLAIIRAAEPILKLEKLIVCLTNETPLYGTKGW